MGRTPIAAPNLCLVLSIGLTGPLRFVKGAVPAVLGEEGPGSTGRSCLANSFIGVELVFRARCACRYRLLDYRAAAMIVCQPGTAAPLSRRRQDLITRRTPRRPARCRSCSMRSWAPACGRKTRISWPGSATGGSSSPAWYRCPNGAPTSAARPSGTPPTTDSSAASPENRNAWAGAHDKPSRRTGSAMTEMGSRGPRRGAERPVLTAMATAPRVWVWPVAMLRAAISVVVPLRT